MPLAYCPTCGRSIDGEQVCDCPPPSKSEAEVEAPPVYGAEAEAAPATITWRHKREESSLLFFSKVVAGGVVGIALGWGIVSFGFGRNPFGPAPNGELHVTNRPTIARIVPPQQTPVTIANVDSHKTPALEQSGSTDSPSSNVPIAESDLLSVQFVNEDKQGEVEEPVETPRAEKAKAPSVEERQTARKKVFEVFGSDVKAAKSSAQRSELAKRVLAVGNETADEPATKYVLYEFAGELASDAGDIETALAAIEVTFAGFEAIDRVSITEPLLRRLSKVSARSKAQRRDLSVAALNLATIALNNERLDSATALLELSRNESKALSDAKLKSQTDSLRERIDFIRSCEDDLPAHRDALSKNPNDPSANLAVGRLRLFGKRDLGGVEYLRRSDDEALKELAENQATESRSASDSYALAEGWRKVADSAKGCERRAMLELSLLAYRSCVGEITGIKRENASKQIDRLSRDGIEVASFTSPVSEGLPSTDGTVTLWLDGATRRPGDRTAVLLPGDTPLNLVWCPSGKFMMGDDDFEDEKPSHLVELDGFLIGRTEITQKQWKAVMGTEPWKGKPDVKVGDNFPASYISQIAATEFCRKLTEIEHAARRIPTDWRFSLPTEAQWEYACRAGTTTEFSFGDDVSKMADYAWYDENASKLGEDYAHEVAKKKPNPWGLFDMHGNLWEWTNDRFAEKYGPKPAVRNPTGPTQGEWRVDRGGGKSHPSSEARSAYRGRSPPSTEMGIFGFRPVLALSGDSGATLEPPSKGGTKSVPWQELAKLPGHKSVNQSVAISPDGRLIASSGGHGKIRLWSTDDKKLVSEWNVLDEKRIGFVPNSKTLISAAYKGKVELWAVPSGKHLGNLDVSGVAIETLAVDPAGKLAVIGDGNGKVIAIDLKGRKVVWRANDSDCHTDRVHCVAFSPDGKRFATSGWDRKVVVWDSREFRPIQVINQPVQWGFYDVVFARDGEFVMASSTDGIHIWKVADGQLIRKIRVGDVGRKECDGRVISLAALDDGMLVLAGRLDGKLFCVNTEKGEVVATLPFIDGSVEQIAVSPDQKMMTFANNAIFENDFHFRDDAPVPLWGISVDELKKPAR